MITLRNIGEAWVNAAGKAQDAIFETIRLLVDQQTIDGDGSPEGVVDAPYTCEYWDYTNNKKYFKSTPRGTKTGWVAIN